jgi:hypothetical protein
MVNTNGRLFTFGCSITQYDWPTWADIAGSKFTHFENWGEAGAGNHFIFNSIIECDIKNNLTPNDTVAIMWSAPARHDYFSGNRWGHAHHVFNTDNKIAFCPDGYWLTTFSYIYAIDQLLKNRKIPYIMTSWMDYTTIDSKFHLMFNSLISKIQFINLSKQTHRISKIADIDKLIKVLYDTLHGPDWPSLENIKKNQYSTTSAIQKEIENFWKDLKNDKRVNIAIELDSHPLPTEHLKIAKTIFPELNIDSNVEQWIHLLDTKLKNGEHITFDKNLPEKNYD